jgi:ankyrin repeat protein
MKYLYTFTLLITTIILHAADHEKQLLLAVESNNQKEIQRLLDQGNVDINSHNYWRSQTVLHFAAKYNHASITKYLVAKGCHINAKNTFGETPLHLAAGIGHRETVIALLEIGADKTKKNIAEETPADRAREKGHNEIVNLIDNWEDLPEIKEPDIK